MMFAPIELFEKEEPGFEGPLKHVPSQLRHCVVAVHKKGKSPTEAWRICRASLHRQGYFKSDDPSVPTKKSMKMTSKGVRRQPKHTFEKGSKKKHAMFARIAPQIKYGR